ncbi:MAG: DNA-3-methyladenine glycosylase [Candidatus Saccharimonadales bacterium]
MTSGTQNPDFSFLNNAAHRVAPRLLGCYLERLIDGQKILVRIVETEAYDQEDVASHSYRGQTERTRVMFGEAGYLYVYFTYGMHYCCNVVTGPAGRGDAVLIRAIEPLEGQDTMIQNRGGREGVASTNGPAKLCQALAINKNLNGHNLLEKPLRLLIQEPLHPNSIAQTVRVGINQAKDVPWRFYIKDNPYVSKQ